MEPWSRLHKRITRGLPLSLSNSFAQPLRHSELVAQAQLRGDDAIVAEYSDHTLTYTPNGGSTDLKIEIAKLYGAGITDEHVLVFCGAQVALQTAAVALASDCHTIVFTPGYQSVVEMPGQASGGNVTKIRLSAANDWEIDIDEVKLAIRADTKYMVINQPHNPTGTLMSLGAQTELVALARLHGIRLMSDEVYRLLEHDDADRLPSMADAYESGISVVTLSKPWGGCGVTIGWLAFADLDIKQRLVDVQYFGTACPSRASELQAIMTLRASDWILARNLKIIRRNLALIDTFMTTYSDFFTWVRPKAGAIAFLKFTGGMTSEVFGSALAEVGISIKPAYCFTDTVTADVDYFRVGFGEEKMPTALAALTAFVEERKAGWRVGAAN